MDKLINIPNLDDLSTDPKDYSELYALFVRLANYCRDKHLSILYRKSGLINSAQAIESDMQKNYDSLPEWAKW